jgi:hypothetical protein
MSPTGDYDFEPFGHTHFFPFSKIAIKNDIRILSSTEHKFILIDCVKIIV